MEQRPLRLGDLVDDYCPRERRITNHAIVALVGDAIKQTRCTACEAEHVYKGGHAPKRRKKDTTSELYEEVLSNAGGQLVTPSTNGGDSAKGADEITASSNGHGGDAGAVAAEPANAEVNGNGSGEPADSRPDETWSAHRPLIRATLPRNENEQPPPRPIPEFTMHQRHGRGGFRQGGGGWPHRGGSQNGNGFRGQGGQPGQGSGQGRRRRGRRRPK
jgi:hypothetical protein